MQALVSAIIITHNRSALLKRAIKSVLDQSYHHIECIVVDDHSTDDTRNVCESFPSVHYIFIPSEESKGGNYARNKGICAAKGKYVAFLDDDDFWLSDKIKLQVQLIEQNVCDLVYCGRRLEIISEKDIVYQDHIPSSNSTGDIHRKILQEICTTTSCILVKRQTLVDIGMYDEELKFWQEYELEIRLAQFHPFYCVCKPLVVYRCDKNDRQRLTNKYYEWKKAVKYIRQKHRNLYQQQSLLEKLGTWQMTTYDAMNRGKAAGMLFLPVCLSLLLFISHIPRKITKLLSFL
jgi:glycosyltransferase involved in cell wall biosynthesis